MLKVIIDQGVQAPLLLAIMISALSLMKGDGIEGVFHDICKNFWTSLLANCTLRADPPFDLCRSQLLLNVYREALDTRISDQHCLCQADHASLVCECGLYAVDHHSKLAVERR